MSQPKCGIVETCFDSMSSTHMQGVYKLQGSTASDSVFLCLRLMHGASVVLVHLATF